MAIGVISLVPFGDGHRVGGRLGMTWAASTLWLSKVRKKKPLASSDEILNSSHILSLYIVGRVDIISFIILEETLVHSAGE